MSATSVGSNAHATEAALNRNKEANAEVSVKVLKKALDTDKQMIAKLLEPLRTGRLDITA